MQPEAGPRYTGRGMAVAQRRNRPIEIVLIILVVLLLVYEAHKHPDR